MPFRDPEKRRAYNREYMRRWYAARAADAEWVADRRTRQREAYRQTGPVLAATITARSANKTAAKYGVVGRLTKEDVQALWAREPVCLNCGRGRGLDHIKPMGYGGTNTPDNIQNLCPPCNQAKHKWDIAPGAIPRPPLDGDSMRCRRGHERTAHMRQLPSGSRYCGPCHAESVARYRARQKAAAA